MPDSARQTQLELSDSLSRARRLAGSIILPIVCLISISTIAFTNDGLSHHIYNAYIYSILVVGFLVSWCGLRINSASEWPYMSMLVVCGFFLLAKFITLILYSTPDDFPLGMLEAMIWLYAVLVYSLIGSTLKFYYNLASSSC
ncbi:hypothetical protein E7T06_19575 [Deinococcus sp. Arct2-2]|uniref:hypothetical protein n=1 Tax=Deinococcus sp. Arct2-2 TaxID=2568653 RepID=UPI0010A4A341|nr:hypothetical protein [Deinococcus sp. Arct2-2]THF67782.1 hypothetical protein E7T06_19575 [Deinococcus sp. Arct2-2]